MFYMGNEMTVKEQALANLRDFKEICDELEIPFMLVEGALLGAYREGDFIKGDEHDIDISIMDEYFVKYDELTQRLLDIGFTNQKKCWVKGELHGGAFVRGANHIDTMRMVETEDQIVNYGGNGSLVYGYDKDVFEDYDEIDFNGILCKTPGKIEKYLEQRYGDWRTPVGIAEYSYTNTKYSPNVRRV